MAFLFFVVCENVMVCVRRVRSIFEMVTDGQTRKGRQKVRSLGYFVCVQRKIWLSNVDFYELAPTMNIRFFPGRNGRKWKSMWSAPREYAVE